MNIAGNILILILICLPCFGLAGAGYTDTGKGVIIEIPEGKLCLTPMSGNTVRVRLTQTNTHTIEELIYLDNIPVPEYTVSETATEIVLNQESLSVIFDKEDGSLVYKDGSGSIILREKARGRQMQASYVQGEPTYIVEQSFVSDKDEYQYGTG